MMRLLVGLMLAGCAVAGKGNSIVGIIDTLTQTVSDTLTPGNSFACSDRTTGVTLANNYYRVFALADHGITTTLHVSRVVFGIESAAAPGGTQPARVKLGTYAVTPAGTTLDPAQIRSISAVDIQIANGTATQMTVPITGDIAPSTNLVVELDVPDGTPDRNVFRIGSNAQGEHKPGYLSASAATCPFSVPTTMQSIAAKTAGGEVDILLSVTGTQ